MNEKRLLCTWYIARHTELNVQMRFSPQQHFATYTIHNIENHSSIHNDILTNLQLSAIFKRRGSG